MQADAREKRKELSRLWLLCAVVALIGTAVLAVGAMERQPHLIFGGVMIWLLAATAWIHERALRPGRDETPASNAEKAAWSQVGMGLAAIMVLGGMSAGSMKASLASYLLFATFAFIVLFFPTFRRRFIEEGRGYREVAEDERDRAIRAQGDYLSKRLVEFGIVAFSITWVLAPHWIAAVGMPLQIAALLLLPVLAANVAGEARVALLHWRDRQ